MSKITFRADDELVEELESFDTSKSKVLRQALREYLDESDDGAEGAVPNEDSLDALVTQRVDELVEERLNALLDQRGERRAREPAQPQDVNVNVTVEDTGAHAGDSRKTTEREDDSSRERGRRQGQSRDEPDRKTCSQCGGSIDAEHVHCPNCGEKASRRVFCECGDELRSDWGFCPGCGRRTAAADVLDSP